MAKNNNGKRSTRGINQDRARRSSEPWERGKKAPKKGNPRYEYCYVTDKNGNRKKVRVVKGSRGRCAKKR